MQQHTTLWVLPIGAHPDANGTRFRVWAHNATNVSVVCYRDGQETLTTALHPETDEHGNTTGYFSAHIVNIAAGTRYMYQVDDGDPRPDPASRWQPDGVHAASCVVDPTAFVWHDTDWHGLLMDDVVVYEVHVGTATPEGTFDALIERLNDLQTLGITAIELMPVADFPGERNWGYDGVCQFAPARAYGGPEGLRRLVQAAHERKLAVLLDVVYNHFGPDGNYLRVYSLPYFTDRYNTPWGDAINFDGDNSRPVRDFFIANLCYWAHEYHIDGVRLDATHAIVDTSTPHILQELATRVRETVPTERAFLMIAENEHNDPNLVRHSTHGGMGLDGVWADDFHHQIRVALAKDNDGYYSDYTGTATDIVTTLQHGWFYTGQFSAHLQRHRGAPASDVAPPHFVHCIQNHDQVGNRALGERLTMQIGLSAYRAASVLLLLSPYTPLLFMGQEWAATTPFLFFTNHHETLGKMVTEGRRAEFASFTAFSGNEIPDPQARTTFESSILRWDERQQSPHAEVLLLYQRLLAMRRTIPALRERAREHFSVAAINSHTVIMRRASATPDTIVLVIFHFSTETVLLDVRTHPDTTIPQGYAWHMLLDSEAPEFVGNMPDYTCRKDDPTTLQLQLCGPRAVVLQAHAIHKPSS